MVEATLSSTFNSPNKDTAEAQTKKPSSVAIFQDAITVNIPIDVTVDLGVALRRTRTKRIDALYEAFPSLKEKEESGQKDDDEEEEDADDEDEEEDAEMEKGEDGEPKKKKKKVKKDKQSSPKKKSATDLVPQRHEFGTIMDYLEAKYVRGVMIENENLNRTSKEDGEEGGDEESSKPKQDEDDEGQGSVYSESSFLDDRDLQRDVAEQVLAQTTTTKLELEGDDDFFVNVGDLAVEETELTQQHYDPLEDSPKKSKPASKKRKKPSSGTAVTTKAGSPPAKKKAAVSKKKKEEKSSSSKKKKDKKKVKVASPKKKSSKSIEAEKKKEESDSDSSSEAPIAVAATTKKTSKKNTPEMKALKVEADKNRKIMQKRFNAVKKMIKELTKEQMPRRPPLKSKVSITCPANKKEGDEVTFANPHIPGQRLRVQVPKGTFAGETFKVTVPVPKLSAGDDDVDHNKFPRELQDELDMYAREYDVFCKHEGEYRHARDEEYPIHLEKRKKYDQVVREFPKNLMTPVDPEYMKKLVRRARQNKSKRTKSAAGRRGSGDAAAASPEPDKAPSSPQRRAPSDNEHEAADQSDAEEEEPPVPEAPTHRTLDLPERGVKFPEKKFSSMDFLQAGGPAGGPTH